MQNKQTKKAILVIDIQEDFTGDNAKMPVDKYQALEMISHLNKLLNKAKRLKIEVIYIGNEYSRFNILNIFRNFAAIRDTPGTQLDHRLAIVSDTYFSKNQGNAFSNPELIKFLNSNTIGEVYISGLYAEACIYATTKGALSNNLITTILSDCIATKNENKKIKTLSRFEKLDVRVTTSDQL